MKDRVSVAITGGIGSGKTTVSKIIEGLGYKVFSCDEIYKEISKTSNYLNEISKVFPLVVENGVLNRSALAEIVFYDSKELKKLNALAHPLILSELDGKIEQEKGLVFCEVPLLFEENLQNKFDYVLIVLRPLSLRVESIVKRDSMTREKALNRIQNQFDYDNMKNLPSNFLIIKNEKGILELKDQVEEAIKIIS